MNAGASPRGLPRTADYLAGQALVVQVLWTQLGEAGRPRLGDDRLAELLAGAVDGARDYAAAALSTATAERLLDESRCYLRNGGFSGGISG